MPLLSTRENLISLFASLKATPLAPLPEGATEADAAHLHTIHSAQVNDALAVIDSLLAAPAVAGALWDVVPEEIRQMFLIAGLEALVQAIPAIFNDAGEHRL